MPPSVHCEWTSPASVHELLELVRQQTEPVDTGFTLMHRLSGAGIVVRTLAAPTTDRPFFGRIFDDRFHIALVPSPHDVTPFHPIARAVLTEDASGGTRIHAELAHHPNARSFAIVFLGGGIALAIGTIFASPAQSAMWFAGLGLSILFAIFPTMQARVRFQQSVEHLQQALIERFDLRPE